MLKRELEKENAELKAKIKQLEEAKRNENGGAGNILLNFSDVSVSLVKKTDFKKNGWKQVELTHEQLETVCENCYMQG